MYPKWVDFVADEPPIGAEAIDAAITDQWRAIVRDRLRYEGASNSWTGPVHAVYGRTFLAAVPVSHGRQLAVWWAFKSDEAAIVLAVRVSEAESSSNVEEPPDE